MRIIDNTKDFTETIKEKERIEKILGFWYDVSVAGEDHIFIMRDNHGENHPIRKCSYSPYAKELVVYNVGQDLIYKEWVIEIGEKIGAETVRIEY